MNKLIVRKRILSRSLILGCLTAVLGSLLLVSQSVYAQVGTAAGRITSNPGINPGDAHFSLGTAVGNLCPQLVARNNNGGLTAEQNDLRVRCGDIINESNDGLQENGLTNMSAEELNAQTVNSRKLNRSQIGSVASRIAALRPAISQTGRDTAYRNKSDGSLLSQSILSSSQLRGGAAGDDDGPLEGGRLGFFVNGNFGSATRDQTEFAAGYDYSNTGVTVGIDYLANNTTVIGLALGLGASDSDFSGNGGSLETDTTSLTAYATTQVAGGWFIDGVIGFGNSDFTNSRVLNYTARGASVNQVAVGETSASQTLLSVGISKSISKSSWDIDFGGRLNHLNSDVDRFSERISGSGNGFGLALEIDDQDITSTTTDLSVRISKAISTQWGVWIPHGSFSFYHEFDNEGDSIRARFLNDPFSTNFNQGGLNTPPRTTTFEIPLDDVDANYGNLGIGSTLLYPNGLSLNFGINAVVGLENVSHVYFSFGVRKDL